MKIGLFFGSFNPVHVGHMIIANHMANHTDLQQVWLVVSPHNPLKKKESLANDYARLDLVQLAIGDNLRLRASNVEFQLPKPSYTIDTLAYLTEQYPEHQFVLIMGGDNLASLNKWKNFEIILRDFQIYVYPRAGQSLGELADHTSVKIVENTPLMDISATFIRACLKSGKPIQYLVPDAVWEEMKKRKLY